MMALVTSPRELMPNTLGAQIEMQLKVANRLESIYNSFEVRLTTDESISKESFKDSVSNLTLISKKYDREAASARVVDSPTLELIGFKEYAFTINVIGLHPSTTQEKFSWVESLGCSVEYIHYCSSLPEYKDTRSEIVKEIAFLPIFMFFASVVLSELNDSKIIYLNLTNTFARSIAALSYPVQRVGSETKCTNGMFRSPHIFNTKYLDDISLPCHKIVKLLRESFFHKMSRTKVSSVLAESFPG
jgi:hypothetical protein